MFFGEVKPLILCERLIFDRFFTNRRALLLVRGVKNGIEIRIIEIVSHNAVIQHNYGMVFLNLMLRFKTFFAIIQFAGRAFHFGLHDRTVGAGHQASYVQIGYLGQSLDLI